LFGIGGGFLMTPLLSASSIQTPAAMPTIPELSSIITTDTSIAR